MEERQGMETSTSDEALVAKVSAGDKAAFGVLVERYEMKLLRYAHKFLFGREDAEDLVQDTFLKAYENINSFDASKKFAPWIYRIAHNTYVNALRRSSGARMQFIDFDTLLPILAARETADQTAHSREERELVERTLGELDPKYREPLVLYFYEEMSYQEIADVLEIPVATVGVRIKRGKDQARTLLGKFDPTYGQHS